MAGQIEFQNASGDPTAVSPSNPLPTGGPLESFAFTIANGASLSGAVNLAGRGILRILMDAAWTTANLTFQVSQDGVTYYDLYDQYGSEYTVTVPAAGKAIILNPADFAGFAYVKVRSGTAGTPVNQGAARVLTLIARPI